MVSPPAFAVFSLFIFAADFRHASRRCCFTDCAPLLSMLFADALDAAATPCCIRYADADTPY